MRKLSLVILGGMAGFVFGLSFSLIVMSIWPTFRFVTDLTLNPLINIANELTGCGYHCYILYFIYPILMAILFTFVGMGIGRLITISRKEHAT